MNAGYAVSTGGSSERDSSASPSMVSSLQALGVGRTGRPESSRSGARPSHAVAPESVRMCRRSPGPASAGTGTTVTPASTDPMTARTVDQVGSA